MKINNITQNKYQNQSFRGKISDGIVRFVTKHPVAIASLAGSTVVTQKIVMSGAEATIGPCVDLLVGKTISNLAGEPDNKTYKNSKVQAVRTSAQAIGGTITGVIIRTACIAASTFVLSKLGEKAGGKIGEMMYSGVKPADNVFQKSQRAAAWGKNLGGAIAIGVMSFTNFLVDAPFINWINGKMTKLFNPSNNANEVKAVKEEK